MDTLELANDYVNIEDWLKSSVAEISGYTCFRMLWNICDENRDHRELWKGVPISRDGKVQLRDGRTGEYFDSPCNNRTHALPETASSG